MLYPGNMNVMISQKFLLNFLFDKIFMVLSINGLTTNLLATVLDAMPLLLLLCILYRTRIIGDTGWVSVVL